ncbi:hypothetical protein HBB16_01935 [Pseudonocardia sp. MCCB 268]|nr:hypothetical protein [Pseudonocardia cytotoxica]
MAPGSPTPVPVEDCYAGLVWAAREHTPRASTSA